MVSDKSILLPATSTFNQKIIKYHLYLWIVKITQKVKELVAKATRFISARSNTAAITVCYTSMYAQYKYWMIDSILFLRPAHPFKLNLICRHSQRYESNVKHECITFYCRAFAPLYPEMREKTKTRSFLKKRNGHSNIEEKV